MLSNTTLQTLVVDDDKDIRDAIARILSRCECLVSEAASVEDAIEKLNNKQFDIVFSDMRFGEDQMGGEELLSYTVLEHPDVKVVLMSSAMNEDQKTYLMGKGASCCLQKPFFKDTCLTVLENIIQSAPAKRRA